MSTATALPTNRVAKTWHDREQWSKKNGLHATVYLAGGENYTGEWKHDLRHGRGRHVGRTFVYEGQWERNERSGFGSLSVIQDPSKPPRLVYTGDWKHNQRNGVGTGFYSETCRYQGHWKDDVRSGWGTMHYPDGARYDGEWYKDVRHGQGILLLANHDRFEGIFVNDQKEGPGKFYYKKKRQVYEGEWSADVPKCGTIRDALELRLGSSPHCHTLPILELRDPNDVLAQQKLEIEQQRIVRLLDPKTNPN